MQFFTTALALTALTSFTSATIFMGTIGGQNIAWFNGGDMCADHVNIDSDICASPWSLDGIGNFQFVGCGDGLATTLNGNFNHVCSFHKDTIRCPQGVIKQQWVC